MKREMVEGREEEGLRGAGEECRRARGMAGARLTLYYKRYEKDK
jgi:hypothetical protein